MFYSVALSHSPYFSKPYELSRVGYTTLKECVMQNATLNGKITENETFRYVAVIAAESGKEFVLKVRGDNVVMEPYERVVFK